MADEYKIDFNSNFMNDEYVNQKKKENIKINFKQIPISNIYDSSNQKISPSFLTTVSTSDTKHFSIDNMFNTSIAQTQKSILIYALCLIAHSNELFSPLDKIQRVGITYNETENLDETKFGDNFLFNLENAKKSNINRLIHVEKFTVYVYDIKNVKNNDFNYNKHYNLDDNNKYVYDNNQNNQSDYYIMYGDTKIYKFICNNEMQVIKLVDLLQRLCFDLYLLDNEIKKKIMGYVMKDSEKINITDIFKTSSGDPFSDNTQIFLNAGLWGFVSKIVVQKKNDNNFIDFGIKYFVPMTFTLDDITEIKKYWNSPKYLGTKMPNYSDTKIPSTQLHGSKLHITNYTNKNIKQPTKFNSNLILQKLSDPNFDLTAWLK